MSRNDELVAVVTGGSRGIGKGVARALAERGATVYIAGRSQAGGIHTSPGGALLPGTIQEAAEEVNSLGGRGIAVACDLSVDEEIRSLFERVRQESGHLNILVNNAAYLNEKMFVRPFWEAPVELANIIDVGLRCHHVATYETSSSAANGQKMVFIRGFLSSCLSSPASVRCICICIYLDISFLGR